MRLHEIFSDAVTTAPVIDDTVRFWFQPATKTFIPLAPNRHHAEMVAVEPATFGVSEDAANAALDRHERAEKVTIPRPPSYQDARHGYLYANHDLIALAMEAGWTRGMAMHPGDTAATVEAASLRDLHLTTRWLAEHMRWGLLALIYDLKGSPAEQGKLFDLDIDSFIKTGRLPKQRF